MLFDEHRKQWEELIRDTLELPEKMKTQEENIHRRQQIVEQYQNILRDSEGEMVLSGVPGKNQAERDAHICACTKETRDALRQAEKDLALARIDRDFLVNKFKANRVVLLALRPAITSSAETGEEIVR